jgi:hypothetical protein
MRGDRHLAVSMPPISCDLCLKKVQSSENAMRFLQSEKFTSAHWECLNQKATNGSLSDIRGNYALMMPDADPCLELALQYAVSTAVCV